MTKHGNRAMDAALARARLIAQAIRAITGSKQGARFTVPEVAKELAVDTDYVRMFLHKYADEKTNQTYNARYTALNSILPYYVVDAGGKKVVYAYGVKPRKPDETFTLTPVAKTEPAKKEPLKQPLADTKIVKIEYARKTSPLEKEKTTEEYLVEIKNEIVVQNAILRDLYNIQRDTYNLFKTIKDGKTK